MVTHTSCVPVPVASQPHSPQGLDAGGVATGLQDAGATSHDHAAARAVALLAEWFLRRRRRMGYLYPFSLDPFSLDDGAVRLGWGGVRRSAAERVFVRREVLRNRAVFSLGRGARGPGHVGTWNPAVPV